MKAGRADFLRVLIQKLDASGVAWCSLRNHHEMFEDSRSDVDLMVLPEDIPLFETFLEEACRETGARLAQMASYLNFSRTYLTPSGQWVRVDYEAEVRWRIFPVLSARSILLRRIRLDGLWVASPADEAVVLWIAALFRNSLSDRYRTRLIGLDGWMRKSFPPAERLYQEAFGPFGKLLWSRQGELLQVADLSDFWADLKLALILRVWFRPSLIWRFFSYFRHDLLRVFGRVLKPRGVYLSIESSVWTQADSIELLWRLDRVFPTAKSFLLPQDGAAPSWRQKLGVARTLFKGGLVVRPASPGKSSPLPRHTRGILIRSEPGNGWSGAVMPGGWMTQPLDEKDPVEACYQICLTTLTMPVPTSTLGRLVFCVALGLDGSGKTTLARCLAQRFSQEMAPPAFRYFHFLPGSPGRPEFPWPDRGAEPKKREPASVLLSVARLFRNVCRAWGGMIFQCRGFRGVLFVDRYLYNYLLDPASVRYDGWQGMAARALRWAPRPDLIFVLETPAELILQRKQELSPEEVRGQSKTLKGLPLVARKVVRLDGSRLPQELADQCLREIEAVGGGGTSFLSLPGVWCGRPCVSGENPLCLMSANYRRSSIRQGRDPDGFTFCRAGAGCWRPCRPIQRRLPGPWPCIVPREFCHSCGFGF